MKEATYDDYLKATRFARWKYKYGLFVLIACWICLIILIVYIIVYSKELSTHPAIYTIEKLGVNDCYCYGDDIQYYINSTVVIFSKKMNTWGNIPSF